MLTIGYHNPLTPHPLVKSSRLIRLVRGGYDFRVEAAKGWHFLHVSHMTSTMASFLTSSWYRVLG